MPSTPCLGDLAWAHGRGPKGRCPKPNLIDVVIKHVILTSYEPFQLILDYVSSTLGHLSSVLDDNLFKNIMFLFTSKESQEYIYIYICVYIYIFLFIDIPNSIPRAD